MTRRNIISMENSFIDWLIKVNNGKNKIINSKPLVRGQPHKMYLVYSNGLIYDLSYMVTIKRNESHFYKVPDYIEKMYGKPILRITALIKKHV